MRLLGNATAEPALIRVLDPAERARAQGMREGAGRCAFVAAHALLRSMSTPAGGRCRDHGGPRMMRYAHSGFGKPSDPAGPRFSLSYRDGIAACATAGGFPIGLDVEPLASASILLSAAASWLHPCEATAVAGLPSREQEEGLVRLWTLKEAFAKALGLGLVLPFRQVGFQLDPVRLVVVEGLRASNWQFAELRMGTYRLALAANVRRRHPIALRFREVGPEELAGSAG